MQCGLINDLFLGRLRGLPYKFIGGRQYAHGYIKIISEKPDPKILSDTPDGRNTSLAWAP